MDLAVSERRDALGLFENLTKSTLIGISALRCDYGDGHRGVHQNLLRYVHFLVDYGCLRRNSQVYGKNVTQIGHRYICVASKVCNRNIVMIMIVHLLLLLKHQKEDITKKIIVI